MTWILVGRVADVLSILGIPTLAAATWSLWKDERKRRATESVSLGCIEFSDRTSVINLVPFGAMIVPPRVGDLVSLPGETREGVNYGGGEYEVEQVSVLFREAADIAQPCPAIPIKLIARVKKRRG